MGRIHQPPEGRQEWLEERNENAEGSHGKMQEKNPELLPLLCPNPVSDLIGFSFFLFHSGLHQQEENRENKTKQNIGFFWLSLTILLNKLP